MRRRTFIAGLTSLLSSAACSRGQDPSSPGSGADGHKPAMVAPPPTWKEHWFEHNQLLKRADFNDTVALYFDTDVDLHARDWLMPYLTSMWQYAQRTYGNSGNKMSADRLYSIIHSGKYFGGHPSTIYDQSHDFRNVSDVGGENWGSTQYDIVTHEAGHVVEFIASGKHGSPAFDLWGDSKWNEFYAFDVYYALGLTKDANRIYDELTADNHVDDFPRANTHWFRDWFYPLWRDYGHAQVMVRYFELTGHYFPFLNEEFSRTMNWGEFVHFMSGAAKVDLKSMATKAFGWPVEWEVQFREAQRDFADIKYF